LQYQALFKPIKDDGLGLNALKLKKLEKHIKNCEQKGF